MRLGTMEIVERPSSLITYEVRCKTTGKRYIGTTQQTLKKRMTGHSNDIQKLIVKGIRSDSFADHYRRFLPKNVKPSPQELRALMDFKVLQKMNPISTTKLLVLTIVNYLQIKE